MNLFIQLFADALVKGALFAMLAVGFGLVWRSLRIFHLAYGGLFVISAYLFFTLVGQVGMSPIVAGISTVILGAGLGLTMELVFYRPLYRRNASSGAILIASIGVLVIIENAVVMIFGSESQTMPRELISLVNLGPVRFTSIQLFALVTGIVSLSFLWLLVRRLRTFKALWAMGDQPELIPALGLPLFWLRGLVMALSSALAAIPACVNTMEVGVNPFVGMSYMLIAAVAVLVGGKDSYRGWILGAFVLAILQSLVIWRFSARWMDLVTFSLLVVMLLFRPRGLVQNAKRVEEG